MQVMHAIIGGAPRHRRLPDAKDFALPGVMWGAFDELLTPAFWLGQAWQHEALGTFSNLRLGRTLAEELAACLLGGFGMPAELGLAAYRRLRDRGLLNGQPTATELERSLSEVLLVDGRPRCYRFPKQRAIFLAGCLANLDGFVESDGDGSLRDQLTAMRGIGLKTASWIVRNYRGSNEVAIIDVHLLRAGRHIGLFPSDWLPSKHYRQLEVKFLEFAAALETPASLLDGLIWHYMRCLSSIRTPAAAAPSIASSGQRGLKKQLVSGSSRPLGNGRSTEEACTQRHGLIADS